MSSDEGVLPLASPLVPLDGLADVTPAELVPESGSRPFCYLHAADMSIYRCKSPYLMPDHPYLGANEWIVGQLARATGVPTRKVELIRWRGQLYVGSELLANDRKMTGPLSEVAWARIRNPEVAYGVVVLDAWTLNCDRHNFNWLGGVVSAEQGQFLANDHDMALLPPPRLPGQLAPLIGAPIDGSLFRSEIIRAAITKQDLLDSATAAARAVSDGLIKAIVGQVPNEWLTEMDKAAVVAFLAARRDLLDGLLFAAAELFPNLEQEAV